MARAPRTLRGASVRRPAALRRTALLAVLALIVLLASLTAAAQPAAAGEEYQHGGTSCNSCHSTDPVTDASCTTCHTGFTSPPSRTCMTCHEPAQSMAAVQTATGCSTGAAGAACHNGPAHAGSATKGCTSCHGIVASASNPDGSAHHKSTVMVTPLLTIGLSKTSFALGGKVTAKGLVKPVATGGVKVVVQRKKASGTWANVTTKTLTGTDASTYSWTYKPGKKGSYRMQARVAATATTPAGKTVYKAFRVK
jgi:hypothetical protein